MEKAKVATWTAEEAAKALRQASYNLELEETKTQLAKELTGVCRDYCKETWMEALNLVEVPASSEWRQAGSVYYSLDICETPAALPSPSALFPESSKQPLTTQAPLPPSEASKGSSQAGDQGQRAEVDNDKGKSKETKPSSKAKDAAKAKDVTIKAKEVEAKSKEADPKTKDTPASQRSKKEDPPPPKAKA